MKKGKKMRKKIVGFMVAGALVLVFGLASTPARAELSLGLVGGYYSPNFGQVNDDLDEVNDLLGTDVGFKAGMMYGLALGYDLPARFGLRLEYNSFESKTSDVLYVDPTARVDLEYKLTVTPISLALTYGFSPFYVGAGVGSFSTELQWGFLVDSVFIGVSDSDSPTGLILLAGFGFGAEPIFLNLEARYIVGTKAKLEDAVTEVDLSGLQLSLVAGLKV